ncbi:DUF4625 domain-containing protein [Flexithrix dorotheae]|uniref:DUF4625 domain-containing protein n=1 Tax=Flexithrix dorotheae TaxID=70993 RepID=UPI000374FB22|nr:DUF4625 domain-containing protein [Flexithrix dorotheae]
MNFKFNSVMFFLAMAAVVCFSSCSDDDEAVPNPTISNLELGGHDHDDEDEDDHDDDHDHEDGFVAHIGEDMHMEADILAEGKIDKITIEIHLEGEHDHEDEDEDHIDEIELEYTTKYEGQKNAEFHEHIDIPENMEAGEYHFHMTVVDQLGNTGSIDADLMIEEEEE